MRKRLAFSTGIIFILISSSFISFIPLSYQDPPTLNIPPTNAYAHAKYPNGTTVNANNFDDTLNLSSLVTNGTTITGLTCTQDHQLHSVTSSGVFTCAPNNTTGTGSTLDTMQNLKPSQASIFARNNTNINFQFKGMNFTGSLSVINGSDILTIHGNVYQNNTGANLGTSGQGVFDSMSGSVLQFLSIAANTPLSIVKNATNVILSDALRANTQSCIGSNNFFSALNNVTGGFTCSAVSGFLTSAITSINSQTGSSITITRGSGISITNNTNNIVIGNTGVTSLTANSPLTRDVSTGTVTISCATCGTGTITTASNIGHGGKGVFSSVSGSTIQLRNITSTNSGLTISQNSTDILLNNSAVTKILTSTTPIKTMTATLSGSTYTLNDTGTNADESFYHRTGDVSYYGSNQVSGAVSTLAPMTANTTYLAPMIVGKGYFIDADKWRISAATTPAGLCMVGIYNDTGSLYPMTLIAHGSDVAASASEHGDTFTAVKLNSNSLYWLAMNCKTATTPIAFNVATIPNVLGYIDTFSGGTGGANGGWKLVQNHGSSGFTLSSTFPGGASVTGNINLPLVIFRAQ